MPKKPKINYRQATLAKYTDGTIIIKIEFPFNPEDVSAVKEIPGRKYHASRKLWTCPPSTVAIELLEAAKFTIDSEIKKYLRKSGKSELKPIAVPGLKKDLFKFQAIGVGFLESKKGRALLADEQGLGKTIQAIGYLQLNPEIRPAIIVAPASVKLNWAKEIRDWMGPGPNEIEILSGMKTHKLSGNIIIINYDILQAWLAELTMYQPKIVIADEIQYSKNGKAKRTKALRALARRVPHFVGLSGTPIVNRPIELFNAIQMINPNIMPNWQTYVRRYCDAKHNGFGLVVNGASNTLELNEILSESIMLRRTKEEVLTDLPDKIRSFFPLEMHPEMEAEYDEAENNFIHWMETRKGLDAAERASAAEALAEIEVLKQVAVAAKLPHAMDWIDDFLDTGEKLIVFCTHKFVVDALMKEFDKEAVKLDGRTSGADRQLVVEKFQNDPSVRLFVGNIQAAGVGITLTAASNVAFLELPWSPGACEQAESRPHRIGQKYTVNVYYLLAEGTIEEKIAKLLDDKRKILSSVLDGVEVDDTSLLMSLIEDYI